MVKDMREVFARLEAQGYPRERQEVCVHVLLGCAWSARLFMLQSGMLDKRAVAEQPTRMLPWPVPVLTAAWGLVMMRVLLSRVVL